jgi:hypothetical protein
VESFDLENIEQTMKYFYINLKFMV